MTGQLDWSRIGGEFVLTEQRARMQSRPEGCRCARAALLSSPSIIALSPGPRGAARATMRHGVSGLRSGDRLTLGIIFHDAA